MTAERTEITPRWPQGNPGSPEAVGAGCICAIMDNGYGHGSGYTEDDGSPAFWVTQGCKIHAPEKEAESV